MARLRVIEILGGPLDGRKIVWDPEIDCMAWTDGAHSYQHAIDEIWTGKRMRIVMRHVATVPLPRRDK
jgi:hypothetical protein